MLGIDYLEWIGYLASALILVSLLMSSIVKLRWINLIGSIVFALYGFLIGAYPVGISNIAIALINIFYLIKIYTQKEYFKILPIETGSEYLRYFLSFYKDDIKKYFPNDNYDLENNGIGFYIVRNMVPAGVFIATKNDEDSLFVELDYVIPEYRDFKIGKYLFDDQKAYFLTRGYNKLYARSFSKDHESYLLKMGFLKDSDLNKNLFVKKFI